MKKRRTGGRVTMPKSAEKHILLIVEDNDDVVSYLVSLFAGEYDVIVATNGEEGAGKAIEICT